MSPTWPETDMGLVAVRGECPGCKRMQMLRSRGLCKACYKNPAVRELFGPLPHRRFADLTGKTFGRLTVLRPTGEVDKFGKRTWVCRCVCGTETPPLATGALTAGNTTSCGCWKLEAAGNAHRTHGMSRSPEYRTWCLMKSRCLDEGNEDYECYGGRGIRIHPPWVESFERFLADVGLRPHPKASINRIDNDGHYEPGNVEWTSQKVQCRNKRNNHMLTHNGETLCLAAWAERTGITARTLWKRVRRGWPAEQALTTP